MSLQDVCGRIQPLDPNVQVKAQARLDRLTKPLGSLGRLEEMAARYVMITGELKPPVPRGAVFTFAADHGVTKEGVSAYPREVTPQMVLNFLRGGAGVNVLARHAGVDVRVVDIGVDHEFGAVPGLIAKKVMRGTRNLLAEPAMTRAQAEQSVLVGVELATQAATVSARGSRGLLARGHGAGAARGGRRQQGTRGRRWAAVRWRTAAAVSELPNVDHRGLRAHGALRGAGPAGSRHRGIPAADPVAKPCK